MGKKTSRKEKEMVNKNTGNEVKDSEEVLQNTTEEEQQAQQPEDDQQVKDEETNDCEKRLSGMQDKYLRLTAEFDNYRKRTLREKTELLKSASEDVLVKILPVMDDFERALNSMEGSNDIEAIRAGIYLIYNKFKEFLSREGIREMNSLSQEFDTDKHEAVTKIPVQEEEKKGKVVDVIEKGYTLNDKVIRYAKVIIGE